MVQLVKLLLPGSFPFLIVGSLLGILLLYGPQPLRALGRRALSALIALYCLLSIPTAVDLFALPLRGASTGSVPIGADAPSVIVLLAGRCDSAQIGDRRIGVSDPVTRLRVMQAVSLYARTRGIVIVSGASPTGTPETDIIKGELVASGVPADRIVLESDSRNTHESATYVTRLLNGRRALLVTSAMHMRRATGSFTKAGAHVVSMPAPDAFESDGRFTTRLTPSLDAFQVGQSAVYEYFGLAYYWGHGWL